MKRIYQLMALGTVVVLALTPVGLAARRVPGKLITSDAIGKLNLGMSAASARAVLGSRGRFEILRMTVRSGETYREYEYRRRADGLGDTTYTIGLQGPRGRLRVVRIVTDLSVQQTKSGIKVGTPARKLYATLGRQLRCSPFGSGARAGGDACILGSRASRHIVFVISGGCITDATRRICRPEKVSRIAIEEPRLPVPWPR